MSSRFYQISEYFAFVRRAKNRHGVHSPFVYDMFAEIFNDSKQFYAFEELEVLRKEMLKSTETIEVTDLGAGSKSLKSNLRKVRSIAKTALTKEQFAQVIFRLINRHQPQTIVELGTSLGLQTAYMALANPNANILTFEGCPNTLAYAKKNFERLGIKNITCIEGNMDDTLAPTLNSIERIDFAFLDGNHTEEATKRYAGLLHAKSHTESIWVVDDIHWSPGMNKAWQHLVEQPENTISIDLFQMGLLFRREGIEKQHFDLKI